MITDDIIQYIEKIYQIDISRPDYEYDLKDPMAGIVSRILLYLIILSIKNINISCNISCYHCRL